MTGVATAQMAVLGALDGDVCLTLDELDTTVVDLPRGEIVKAAGKLVEQDFAERVERGCFQLTARGRQAKAEGHVIKAGPKRPHTGRVRTIKQDTLRQRAWNVMRLGQPFTVPDLALAAACGERRPENNLQKYCAWLVKAGYLILLPTRVPGTRPGSNGFRRYRLVDDTGPQAPLFKPRTRSVFDVNKREERPCR